MSSNLLREVVFMMKTAFLITLVIDFVEKVKLLRTIVIDLATGSWRCGALSVHVLLCIALYDDALRIWRV